MRFIEVLCSDAIKTLYLSSQTVLSREGLETRNHTDNQPTFYDAMVEVFNDENWRIYSSAYPELHSDYLTFCTSDIIRKLSAPNFLFPGLTLFGDNAYVNCDFMTTPFKGVRCGGLRDAFNFYHSSTRIKIECAFGVLVHRFGCLRKPLPPNLKIRKITSLVRCLCILHNFCINERLLRVATKQKFAASLMCEAVTQNDMNNILLSGGRTNRRLDRHNDHYNNLTDRPNEILDGGDHFNDVPRNRSRILPPGIEEDCEPRSKLLEQLVMRGLVKRPRPRGSTTTNKS